MNGSNNAQITLASALRAAGVRLTNEKRDDTAAPVSSSSDGWHGSLRDAFATAFAASPQATDLSSPDAVDIGYVKPIALADITDGWGDTRPTLFQPETEDGQTFVIETKPWKVELGSDAMPATAGALGAGADLAAVLTAAAPTTGRTSGSALTDALQKATQTAGGSAALEGSAQQLVQAMAGFRPQGAGEALTVASAVRDPLGGVLANPLG